MANQKIRAPGILLVLLLIFTSIPVTAATAQEPNPLPAALGVPVGMQGFTGHYAITSPDEPVEIYVQFHTPPAVALRLMHERGILPEVLASLDTDFERRALAAHDVFRRQLWQIPVPLAASYQPEIINSHYWLFNGVLMRVPGWMAEMIAELPEVYGVFPNVAFEPAYSAGLPSAEVSDSSPAFSPASSPVSFSPHFANSEFMLETREHLNIDYIHNTLGITGAGVRVAVWDTGIYHSHPEFARFLDDTGRVPGWHFYGDNSPAPFATGAYSQHGTVVAGAVVAMSPGIELYHYRVRLADGAGGTTSGGSTVSAVEQAHRDGMDVMNLSFGGPAPHPFSFLESVVNLAVMDGVVVVTSAGNSGAQPFTVGSPGLAALALTVGSGTAGGRTESWQGDTIAGSSSRGPVGITHHIKPDIVASGVQVYTTNLGGGYTPVSGTSLAAPVIAGLAALLIEAFPEAETWEIKARLMNTARPLADLNPTSVFTVGAGFVQPEPALRNDTLVSAVQYVPIHHSMGAPFQRHAMASLNFGAHNIFEGESMDKSIPVQVANSGQRRVLTQSAIRLRIIQAVRQALSSHPK